jgi:hypothetical protein
VSFEFVFTDVHYHRQRQRRVRRLLVMGNVIMVTCCAVWRAIAIAIPLWPIAAVDVVGIFACGILAVVLRRRGLRMARHLFLMTVLAFLLAIMALEPTAPGYLPIVHLWHVAQKGKTQGAAAPALRRYYDVTLKLPIDERIARLRSANFSNEK